VNRADKIGVDGNDGCFGRVGWSVTELFRAFIAKTKCVKVR